VSTCLPWKPESSAEDNQRDFPLTNPNEINEGEMETLREKLELLMDKKVVYEKNVVNLSITQCILNEAISKSTREKKILELVIEGFKEKITALEDSNKKLEEQVKMEQNKRKKVQKTADKVQACNSKLIKELESLTNLKQLDEETIEKKNAQNEYLLHECEQLRGESEEKSNQLITESIALEAVKSREKYTMQQMEEILGLVDKSLINGYKDKGLTCGNDEDHKYRVQANKSNDIMCSLKISVLNVISENQQMSLNDAVLRTEIDRLRSTLQEVWGLHSHQRSSSILSWFRRNSSTTSTSELNLVAMEHN